MSKELAAERLGVETTVLKAFEVEDYFNQPNVLKGYLVTQRDHRFGALLITEVNDEPLPDGGHLVYCTPKLKYPFNHQPDGQRTYNWPKNIIEYMTFEKVDGTNILAYSYPDAQGNIFCTFKTRLTVVVQESEFGPFRSLWESILEKYPELRAHPAVKSGEYALSFELYGSANPILIEYDFHIKTRFLFSVKQDSASILHTYDFADKFELPREILSCLQGSAGHANQDADAKTTNAILDVKVTQVYEEMRDRTEKDNSRTEDGMIKGSEGHVFYIKTLDRPDHCHMYKCKPESVENVHMSGGKVPRSIILTETWKCLELVPLEDLEPSHVVTRLEEEFTNTEISSSNQRIQTIVGKVKERALFMRKMRKALEKLPEELYKTKDRPAIMRALSPHFAKREMKTVYTALKMQDLID